MSRVERDGGGCCGDETGDGLYDETSVSAVSETGAAASGALDDAASMATSSWSLVGWA